MLLAVALGAFGAHALAGFASEQQLKTWHTAIEYQVYHALGLVALAIYGTYQDSNRLLLTSGVLFIAGIVLFCGSLYLLVLIDLRALGMITPIGGVLFLAAWLTWLIAVLRGAES